MKLIFAQGNPGSKYAHTRHNTGFIVVDGLAEAGKAAWKLADKFKAEIAEISLGNEKVLLVKPLSFYNQTGQVARAIVDFYKLDPVEDVLVIHDELALPFGTIRVRQKGSDAGNNGIKSLNAHLGPDYARIRVGVWNETRDLMEDSNFVLSNFSQAEQKTLDEGIIPQINTLIETFVKGELEAHSAKINP